MVSKMDSFFSRESVNMGPHLQKAPKGVQSPAPKLKKPPKWSPRVSKWSPKVSKIEVWGSRMWSKRGESFVFSDHPETTQRLLLSSSCRHGGGSARSELDIYIYIYILCGGVRFVYMPQEGHRGQAPEHCHRILIRLSNGKQTVKNVL